MSCVTNRIVTSYWRRTCEHEVLEVGAGLRVDRRERLVHQQDRRLVGERARDRHPLLHAARELPRVLVHRALQSDRRQRLLDDPASARSSCAAAGTRRSGARSSTGTASGCTPGRPAPACRAARPVRPIPAVGSSSPLMHFSSVVLPHPDGPTTHTNSPARDLERDVGDRLDGAVALLQVFDAQHLSSARWPARRGATGARAARPAGTVALRTYPRMPSSRIPDHISGIANDRCDCSTK